MISFRGDLVEPVRILNFLVVSMEILLWKPYELSEEKRLYIFFFLKQNHYFFILSNVSIPSSWQTQMDGEQLSHTQRHTCFDSHTFGSP